MDYLIRSIQYAFRLLVKSPAFTIIAVVALALGISAVTSMFSVINAAVIRGLPFEDPHELMFVKRWNQERQPWNTSIPLLDYQDINRDQQCFEFMAAWFGGTVNVSIDNNPVRFNGSRISHTWLDIIGVEPVIGRNFTAEEDTPGANPVLILGYAAWKSHYSGDPDVIGKSAFINGKPGTVIGVMPKDFNFPNSDDVWLPLNSQINAEELKRGSYSMNVMARLNNGIDREQAELEMTNLVKRLATQFPDTNGDFLVASVEPIAGELLGDQTVKMMWIMLAMGGFVLLIACANVANLLLARSTLRTKELAIRSSLGATRLSIMGQLLVESLLLSVLGAVGGAGLSVWATGALQDYGNQMQMPFWLTFDLDLRVMGMVTGVTLLAGLISGIAPAIKASKVSVTNILKDDTRTGSSLRMGLFSKGLVVVQVAISSILLILTVLMMRSVQNITSTDLHFDTDSVFTARMGLFEGTYPTPVERYNLYYELKRNVAKHPEVQSVALYGRYRWTMTGINWSRLKQDGKQYASEEDMPYATNEIISPEYFDTLGVDLIAGRAFNDLDTPDSLPVTIINEALANKLFPNTNPVGKRIMREPFPGEKASMSAEELEAIPWLTIVGVAPSMAAQGIGNQTDAEGAHYYLPMHPENAAGFMTIAARGPKDPMKLTELIRQEVIKLDPNLPLYAVATPADVIEEDTRASFLISNIFKVFGMLAVFLASIGIYGIMSFSVNQRFMEFGIRSALGATSRNILVLVMKSGLLQFLIGLGLGLVGAYFFSQLLRNFLFGVSLQDPMNYLAVALIFTLVAISACLMPAKRAARVDPAEALRYE